MNGLFEKNHEQIWSLGGFPLADFLHLFDLIDLPSWNFVWKDWLITVDFENKHNSGKNIEWRI